TERPEAIAAGAASLVGTDEGNITHQLAQLLDDDAHYARMSRATNPYGDGRATGRVLGALKHHFGLAPKLPDFDPASLSEPAAAGTWNEHAS
ncbi:UDP-N-acetylglucosamine 2-epimerase, partial [Leifsonia shinshuensis]